MNRKGFTLVETIIYIGIIGAVAASFVSFSIFISNSRNKTYVGQEVQANSRTALNFISQKIKMSNGVNIGLSTFDIDPGVLSLSMANPAVNPTIFSLDADNGILQITEGANPPVNVVSNKIKVTNLMFTNQTVLGERENVSIDMTLEYDNPSGDVEFNYSHDIRTTVGVRN